MSMLLGLEAIKGVSGCPVLSLRSFWAFLFPGVCCFLSVPLNAQDVVFLQADQPGVTPRKKSGQILDYTARQLVLRQSSGREVALEASQVLEVKTKKLPTHVKADQAFAEQRLREALDLYREAAKEEDRTWVRHEIKAMQVWCYRHLGSFDGAAKVFLAILQEEPQMRHFDAIPLAWTSVRLTSTAKQVGEAWLTAADNSIATLIAASWLLTTPGSGGRNALRRLANVKDARVAFLARAQQWRTKVVSAKRKDVSQWQEVVRRMPSALRAGPYYVVGRTLTRLDDHEHAAIALLRIPILYPRQRALSVQALMSVARSLESVKREEQAVSIYRELLIDYPEAGLRSEIEQRLERLSGA